MAAAREAWKSPRICQNSSRQVRVPDRDPQIIFTLLMIPGFPLNGLHLPVPVALMSSAPTASQTPLMPFSTLPASLTVRENSQALQLHIYFYLIFISLVNVYCVIDFTFSSEACGAGAASGGGGGGGGRGSSLDQDSLGGSVACEEHEVASLTTLHLDSETSSLSHTVTVTGNAHNVAT